MITTPSEMAMNNNDDNYNSKRGDYERHDYDTI